jgi:hypothetical protein
MGRSIRCCSWNDILQVSFSTPTGWKYFVEDGSGIWFLWSAPFECACMLLHDKTWGQLAVTRKIFVDVPAAVRTWISKLKYHAFCVLCFSVCIMLGKITST